MEISARKFIAALETKAIGNKKKNLDLVSATNAYGIVVGGQFHQKREWATEYKSVKNRYKKDLFVLVNSFQAGEITKSEASKQFKRLSEDSYKKAFRAGSGFSGNPFLLSQTSLDKEDNDFVKTSSEYERKFFKNFLDDIESFPDGITPEGMRNKMNYDKRTEMYVESLDAMFGNGYVAGLPLETELRWRLCPGCQHCSDCLNMAAGSPYTVETLPFYPRSGYTRCLSNCKCTIEVIGAPDQIIPKEQDPGRPSIVPEGTPEHIHQEFDELFDRMNYHRQMMDITDGDEKAFHIQMRKEFNTKIIAKQDALDIAVRPRYSVKSDLLETVRGHTSQGNNLVRSPLTTFNIGDDFSAVSNTRIDFGKITKIDKKNGIIYADTVVGETDSFYVGRDVFFSEKFIDPVLDTAVDFVKPLPKKEVVAWAKTIEKAEETAVSLGVKKASYGKYSNLSLANSLNRSLGFMREKGIPVPESLSINAKFFLDRYGDDMYKVGAAYNNGTRTVYINPWSNSFSNSSDLVEYSRDLFERGLKSTSSEHHILIHETAHYLHDMMNSSSFLKSSHGILETEWLLIGKEVSKYAAKGRMGIEFVAEVYVGVKTGRKYSKKIIDLYNKVGGPPLD